MWHLWGRSTHEPDSAESPPSNSGSDGPEIPEARRCSWFSRFMGQTSSDTSEPDTGVTEETCVSCLGGFLADVLNGVSQVCFFTNPVAGVVFLAAVLVGIPRTATINCLAGGLSATCCSRCFSLDSAARKDGTLGYNGVLVGCALAAFMEEFWWSIPLTIVAAGISSLVVAGLLKIITPQLTLAFNFCVFSTMVLKNLTSIPGDSRSRLFEITWTSVLPEFTVIEFMEAVLNGVSQIYFVSSPFSGILILVGICIAHPFSSFSTLLGSLLSTLLAARCGADRPRLEDGDWAYNACLISLWMSFYFRPLGYLPAFFLVCFGALATTAAYAAMDGIVAVTHGVAPSCFTLPFNSVGLLSVALHKIILYIHFRTKKAPSVEDLESQNCCI